jgi:hypothetical protein
VTNPVLGLLPDAERLVANFLREDARVSALIADRVYTVFPAKAGTDALLIVQRVGGEPPFSIPLVLDSALLQLDAYGGPKQAAQELIATTRAALTELRGVARPEGVVSEVSFGPLRWLPDETFNPNRPRYVADVTITVRTPVAPASGPTESASPVSARTRVSA